MWPMARGPGEPRGHSGHGTALSDNPIHFGTIDLTNCDREPIHTPGLVQPHGALLTFDPQDLRVVHAGGDTVRFLRGPPIGLLGAPASDIMAPAQQDRLQALLDGRRSLVRPVFAFTMARDKRSRTDILAHLSDGLLVLEFEPRRPPVVEDLLGLVQGMVHHVQRPGSLQAFFDTVATEVRELTGFDRVMVYRFSPDDSGEVVAEARGEGIESFFGLNFPAGDIPQQARALYVRNWTRHIPDARYSPLPIIPPLNPLTGRPLDLSHSVLRSVSPVHRQYLANMGVVASMSLSLLVRGRLWGLIACHNHAPRYLSQRLRDACGLFAEMTSSHLEMKLTEIDLAAQLQTTRIHEELVARMNQEADLAHGLIRFRPNLLDLIPAGGVGVWIEGRFSAIGSTPTLAQVKALVDWLNATDKDGVYPNDCLSAVYPPAREFADVAGGLLALSVSRTPRDYLLWFRPEISKTMSWAGSPAKRVEVGPEGGASDAAAQFRDLAGGGTTARPSLASGGNRGGAPIAPVPAGGCAAARRRDGAGAGEGSPTTGKTGAGTRSPVGGLADDGGSPEAGNRAAGCSGSGIVAGVAADGGGPGGRTFADRAGIA
jgi:chemotaxis family two-component system sensor kinase Cph1